MEKIFFDDWQSIVRALLITIMAYIIMVILIRISGKRTLAKMNAYDFVVTVALGSCLAAVSLNKSIALAEGAVVFFTLICLQFIITFTAVRVQKVQQLVSGKPVMLLYQGVMLRDAMKKERITEQDMYLSAREKGIVNLEDIAVVVLETTGEITVIAKSEQVSGGALQNVLRPE